jgi:3-dehydroquinate dehydratase
MSASNIFRREAVRSHSHSYGIIRGCGARGHELAAEAVAYLLNADSTN